MSSSSNVEFELARGSRFAGRFEIVERLGAGGFATVYRALDLQSGDEVAVKFLGDSAPDSKLRFEREASVLATVDHPGVVRYHAHGQVGAQQYLVTDWVAGVTLARHFTGTGTTVREAVELTRSLAEALSAVHQAGLIHRDVKPANVIVRTDGRVVLIDFGIARLASHRTAITGHGVMVGTPGFIAPEQARGLSTITPAADVFALGCLLYVGLTGRTPFTAGNAALTYIRILGEAPAPVGVLCPEAPRELVALVNDMLSKVPEQRPADGAAVVARIDALSELPEGPRRRTLRGQSAASPTPASALTTIDDSTAVTEVRATTTDDVQTLIVVGIGEGALSDDACAAIRATAWLFDPAAEVLQLADGSAVVKAVGSEATSLIELTVQLATLVRHVAPDRAVVVAPGSELEWALQAAQQETFARMMDVESEMAVLIHIGIRDLLGAQSAQLFERAGKNYLKVSD